MVVDDEKTRLSGGNRRGHYILEKSSSAVIVLVQSWRDRNLGGGRLADQCQ